MKLTHATITKTVASAGTPEALAPANTFARSATVRAISTNTGDTLLSLSGSEDYEIAPGQEVTLGNGQTVIDLSKYTLDAETTGEGVTVWYWMGNPGGSLALESKVEMAAVKLINAIASDELFDGVSVTAGLTTQERKLNSIVAYVPSCEQLSRGGQWNVTLEVHVMTQYNQPADDYDNDRFHLHRARTDAVRCLFLHRNAPEALMAVQPGLYCVINSLQAGATIESEPGADERVFTSKLTCNFIASGEDH